MRKLAYNPETGRGVKGGAPASLRFLSGVYRQPGSGKRLISIRLSVYPPLRFSEVSASVAHFKVVLIGVIPK